MKTIIIMLVSGYVKEYNNVIKIEYNGQKLIWTDSGGNEYYGSMSHIKNLI